MDDVDEAVGVLDHAVGVVEFLDGGFAAVAVAVDDVAAGTEEFEFATLEM